MGAAAKEQPNLFRRPKVAAAFPQLGAFTVLTRAELAVALSTSEDTIARSRLPVSYGLGDHSPRYVWRLVVAYLEKAAREPT